MFIIFSIGCLIFTQAEAAGTNETSASSPEEGPRSPAPAEPKKEVPTESLEDPWLLRSVGSLSIL